MDQRNKMVAQAGSTSNTTPNSQLVVVRLPARLSSATQTTSKDVQIRLDHCAKQEWVVCCHQTLASNGLFAGSGWPQPPFQTRPYKPCDFCCLARTLAFLGILQPMTRTRHQPPLLSCLTTADGPPTRAVPSAIQLQCSYQFPKIQYPLHRIFGHIYKILNIVEKITNYTV